MESGVLFISFLYIYIHLIYRYVHFQSTITHTHTHSRWRSVCVVIRAAYPASQTHNITFAVSHTHLTSQKSFNDVQNKYNNRTDRHVSYSFCSSSHEVNTSLIVPCADMSVCSPVWAAHQASAAGLVLTEAARFRRIFTLHDERLKIWHGLPVQLLMLRQQSVAHTVDIWLDLTWNNV